jgi:hypothetical protein
VSKPGTLAALDELTLNVLAIIDGTTAAEQRRNAVRDYCRRARQDKNVAEIVRLILASQAQRRGSANVIEMRKRNA